MSDTTSQQISQPLMQMVYERSEKWGFLKTSLSMLLTYLVSWVILSGLYFSASEPGRFEEVLGVAIVLAVLIGGLCFLICLVMRATLKWTVHPFSMGILISLIQLCVLSLLPMTNFAAAIVISVFWGDDAAFKFFDRNIDLYPALGLCSVLFVIGYRYLSRAPDERTALPKYIEVFAGFVFVTILCRLFQPALLHPVDFGQHIETSDFSRLMAVPLLLLVATFFATWLKAGQAVRILIWPLALFVILQITDTYGSDAEFVFVLYLLGPIALLLLGLFVFYALIPVLAFMFSTRSKAARTNEVFGSLFMPLEKRFERIALDAVIAAILFALYAWSYDGYFTEIQRFSGDLEVIATFFVVLNFSFFAGATMLVSLVFRFIRSKRARIVQVLLIGFLGAVIAGLLSAALNAGSTAIVDRLIDQASTLEIFLLIVANIGVALNYVVLAGLIYVFSRISLTKDGLAKLMRFILGAVFVAFVVETMGGNAADQTLILQLQVGEMATLLILAVAALHYRYLEGESYGFITWPVTAFFASCLFATIFRVQSGVEAFNPEQGSDELITGWAEIMVSVFFGVAMSHVVIIGKRIWHDRDPQARQDAIRIRGALYIFYGLWPVFAIMLVMLALAGFRADVRDQINALAQGAEEFQTQGARLGKFVSDKAEAIETDAERLNARIQEAIALAKSKGKELPAKLEQIAEDTVGAAKRSGEKIVDQGIQAGKDTIGRVGDKISDGLPTIDLGIFGEISFPDLGLADFFTDAFAWDTGFQTILDNFVQGAMSTVTAEFAGPLQDLEVMVSEIQQDMKDVSDDVQAILDDVKTEADQIIGTARNEYKEALDRADAMIVQAVIFFKHLVILFFYFSLILFAWLIWRAIGAIAVMWERVSIGWEMMVNQEDAELTNAVSEGA